MFFEAPWRTGKLAQSITKQVEGLEASVGPLVSYAGFVEFGTAPHEIKPIRANVLAFQGVDGKLAFSAVVRHPGTKANPFMQRTKNQIEDKALAIFGEEWASYVGEST
jgi:HK97 gp10 family phage protein